MKTIERVRRELFNDYFDMMQSIAEPCGHSLGQYHKDLMEAAFNAALDSIIIELPALKNSSSYYDGGDVYDSAINQCRYKIEALNLGIKIK